MPPTTAVVMQLMSTEAACAAFMYLQHLLRYGQAEPAAVQATVREACGDVTPQLCLEILEVPAQNCWD